MLNWWHCEGRVTPLLPSFLNGIRHGQTVKYMQGVRPESGGTTKIDLRALKRSLDLRELWGQYRRTLDDIEKLKQESVFFYLVGQRALLLSLIELVASRDAPELASKCGISLNDFRQNMQDFYAVYLGTAISDIWNRNPTLFQKGYKVRRDSSGITSDLASELWAGALVRREQPDQVDFSENAARRGSRWFTLMAHLYWFVQINKSVQDDVEKIVSAVDDDSKLDKYSAREEGG